MKRTRLKDKGDDGDHLQEGRSGGNAAQKMRWVTVLSHDERCQSESVIWGIF